MIINGFTDNIQLAVVTAAAANLLAILVTGLARDLFRIFLGVVVVLVLTLVVTVSVALLVTLPLNPVLLVR